MEVRSFTGMYGVIMEEETRLDYHLAKDFFFPFYNSYPFQLGSPVDKHVQVPEIQKSLTCHTVGYPKFLKRKSTTSKIHNTFRIRKVKFMRVIE